MSNKQLKEQCIIMLVMVVIMGAVLVSTYEEPDVTATSDKKQYEGIIRLHVVANSDSKEDQEVKLKVRDAVISQVGDLEDLEASEDLDSTRKWLKSHLDDVTETADTVLAENGCNYRASAELGVRWIPEKTYGDMHFPAGNYEALTITLGKGEGENWWCVLFPPLCLITEDEAQLEAMGIDSQDQIEVRSWLKEVLER